jgi:hypothetical protein
MSVKISQLPAATSVTSDDLVPIVDSGSLTTKRSTAGQVLEFITGSTFNTLTVTNLTASVSGTFVGDGSGLINLTASNINNFTNDVRAQFTAGTNIDISGGVISVTGSLTSSSETFTSGNVTGSGTVLNPVTLKDDITLNSVTANILSGTQISGANAVISGDVLIYGSASFTQDPDFAYVVYDSGSDKIVIFPGLKVSGSTVISGNLDVTGTISASNYIGLPTSSVELPKLIVSSSVSLLTTQRAVFAKNSDSSSISITLPSASLADSREYYVIKSDSVTGSVNILPSSPNLINGTSSFELNGPFQSVTLIHDGTDWYVF